MQKQILGIDEIREVAKQAITEVSGVVKQTLGPGGRVILIARQGQTLEGTPLGPKITKDGVSVADECFSPDPKKDVFMQAIKGICRKTVNDAGDGTTTAMVLGEAIYKETLKILTNTSLNPQLVRESVEAACLEVVQKLKEVAIPVKNMEMIRQVATISANGDDRIGTIISKAFEHVGAEGVVTIDEGHTSTVTLEVVDGYQFNRGIEGRTAFFNNKDNTLFEAEGCAVLIFDGKLYNHNDLIPALKILAGMEQDGKPTKKLPPVIVIANEFSNEVLQFLLIQKTEAGLQFCPVQGPHTTHVRTEYYNDLAYYTGGTRLGNGARGLGAIKEDDIGYVGRVVSTKYKTTLYDGHGAEDEILIRVEQLRKAKETAESPYDAQVINDRVAALTNGIAKIGVGGNTELEIKEKYDRIEDALNAARAAIQEGVVPGGGCTLLRISKGITSTEVGHQILKVALLSPFFQILDNIGMGGTTAQCTADEILVGKNTVYDARHKKIVDALDSGVIDPVKVTRVALENAVSIAGLLSTAGGAIIYVKDQE